MKTFAIASVIALASVASAQFANLPTCAVQCVIGPITNDGCGSLTDFKCHCEKGASLIGAVTPCVQSSCSPTDLQAVLAAVSKTCADAGVPLQLPAAGAAPSGTAPSSAAHSMPAGSPVPYPVPSSMAMPSMAGTATAAPSASATKSSSLPAFTGGAPQATQAAGVLAAAALALLAL